MVGLKGMPSSVGQHAAAQLFDALAVELGSEKGVDLYLKSYYSGFLKNPDFFRYHFEEKAAILASLAAHLFSERLRPLRALDVGCGPGTHTLLLRSCGAEVDAVDLDAEALEAAKHRSHPLSTSEGIRWIAADGSRPTDFFPPYDLIFTQQALAQFPSPAGFVAASAAAQESGGVLVVSEGNPRHPRNALRHRRRQRRREVLGTGRVSVAELAMWCENHGYAVELVRWYGHLPPITFRSQELATWAIRRTKSLSKARVASSMALSYLLIARRL